ncbi:member of the syntaxin family of t-SNARE [Strigomonas culicis]|uniref:Member of the syntaxin family of t-SNARE n=1 Tax=Strigomonas culicis TaxID=28005 RepID=S9VI74_9TRYP|nr:member of the syntaxin family of t-SNARE [Strigomonas culicis]|eukprot:EPY26791.1 member of the syntaxin family of t-SNARE [Strigomonas culicis]
MAETTYHQEHQKKIGEQNVLLDQIHNSVMNTRHYAVQIGDELQQQDGMLNDLHQDIQRTTDESRRQNRNVIQLLRESESRGFYSVVIFLVVVLVILLMI